MPIPKIIHQTWKTEAVPAHWAPLVESWKRHHPDWEYRLWTDADNRKLIADRFPAFLPVYDGYSFNINRADAVRYCLLYEFGGLYVDMDFECLRSLDELLTPGGFIVTREPEEHQQGGIPAISNALMASTPGHPFLLSVIDHLQKSTQRVLFHGDVLTTTGPIMLSRVAETYKGDDISYLEPNMVFPLVVGPELAHIRENGGNTAGIKTEVRSKGAYAIHYWANTWVRSLGGELVNPHPYTVQGYDFYPGLDSVGHDLGNFGRDIHRCARLCDENRHAVGFNTDGFLKYYIQPRFRWDAMADAGEGEGLYVKRDRLRSWRATLRHRYIATALALTRLTIRKASDAF